MIGGMLASLGALIGAPHLLTQWVAGAPWKLAGIVLAVGAALFLWLWIAQLRQDVAEFRQERVRLHQELSIHRTLLDERDRAIRALIAAEAEAAIKRKRADAARKEIRDAPMAEDGDLAPVLRRALERLR